MLSEIILIMKKKIKKLIEPVLFETEKKFYEQNKSEILKKYANKYIAIIGKKIVASSKDFYDFSDFYKRVAKKYGYGNIYMPFVTEKRIYRIATPFVVKRINGNK